MRPAETAIPVGGFTLDAQIGGGGHGLVWRGRHDKSGLPVALKVLPPTADRFALHGLKNEVQAIARLHHPHIVAVLDTGLIDERAAKAAKAIGKPLEIASPWVAFELASGGDLAQLAPPLAWGALSDVLRTLLSALAHAHARGVVHRDLKPANVLMCANDDARPGLKLTDFGLAHWERGARLAGGTPLYMAPEQFDLDARDVGPWTDLYALGGLAVLLATGAPVFTGAGWRALEKKHREERVPPLSLGSDVPSGFEGFVRRLLEKDPADRFRCAADADAALAELDEKRQPPPSHRLPDALDQWTREHSDLKRSLQDAVTVRRSRSLAPDEKTEALIAPMPRVTTRTVGSGTTTRPKSVDAVAPPSNWRAVANAPVRDLRLVEAGLSLWGMRPVPLVGRHEERDALWRSLLDVHQAKAARLVCVRGASGVGKSRLVEWTGHRCAELGAARVLKASFSDSPARSDGFAGMVARLVGSAPLDDDALACAEAWLARWLPGDEVSARELCALAGAMDGVFSSADERHGALIRLLTLLARERPLLVWLDDVQWGADALALVERVLNDAPELRALFVVTAVDELLSNDSRAQLDAWAERAQTTTLPIGPLDEQAHDELCHLLLGDAASDLAEDLRRRTEGNPMFAVHVVGDWVQRGLLVASPRGLVLREGASAALPPELFRLWDQRVGAALAALKGANFARALEVAAVLGSSVDLVEWEAATRLDRPALDSLVDALVASGLARRTEAGFSFVHVLLRSSVERHADKGGTLVDAHRAAADALALLWGTDTPAAIARIGRHLLAAGRAEEAAQYLVRAARAALDEGEIFDAAAILVDWEHARAALGIGDDDARAAAGLLLRARVAAGEGRHADARAHARAVQSASREPRLLVQAACVEAKSCIVAGDTDTAHRCYERARSLATSTDDKVGLGLALLGLGEVEFYRGDRAMAAAHYRAASVIMQETGRKHDQAQLLWALGYVELEEGRLTAAQRMFEEQRTLCRAIRDRLGEANAENALGELARSTGRLPEADRHYRAALRIATRSGLSRRWMFRLNLAHTRLASGDVEGAAQIATEVLDSPLARAEAVVSVGCLWIVAVNAARLGDVVAFERAAREAWARGARSLVEDDLARIAQQAGDAIAPHDRALAELAWRFAREQLRALGRPEDPPA